MVSVERDTVDRLEEIAVAQAEPGVEAVGPQVLELDPEERAVLVDRMWLALGEQTADDRRLGPGLEDVH